MKFSTIFLSLLATFVAASPITTPETNELTTRETFDDTPEYTAAIKAHSGLDKDKFYYFTLEWPLKAAVGDGDKETDDELAKLRKKLGFEHVGVVFGQITETKTGKGKNEKTKRDFKGTLVHMTKKNLKPGDTAFNQRNWKADTKTLKYQGGTTSKKIDAAIKEGKEYVADNKIYDVDKNNCDTFAKAVMQKLD